MGRIAVLIEREPNNLQAQSLNQLIEKGVARGKLPLHSLSLRLFDAMLQYLCSLTLKRCFWRWVGMIEGYLGMALIGGAAAVASIALAGLMRRGRR